MKKTIRAQIMFGYMLIVAIPICITLITVGSLISIRANVRTLDQNRINQNATKDAIVGHYAWIADLSDTILTGEVFTGSLDATTCSLGKWMDTVSPEDLKDSAIVSAINRLKIPHNEIHSEAQKLIDLSKTDVTAANDEYMEYVKPKVTDIIEDITVITNKYKSFAEASTNSLNANIVRTIIIDLILVVAGVFAAILIGRRTSDHISKPIELVANCSQKLALGDDNVSFKDVDSLRLEEGNEALIMIKAFEVMVKSVQDNAAVIQRVAEGDLTAFVDIRSASDSLGKNLYHMVQSNDLMFSQILQVASEVASSADQIAQSSQVLADSATMQAGSAEYLSTTVSSVNELTMTNKQKVQEVTSIFAQIQNDVNNSNEKMETLVHAVDDITIASDKISAVIKTIDNIAFQTNILALNASVEAARAGVAGKGFAVVADEVRSLAGKSALAAEETKELIINTIDKAHTGSLLAKETSETFQKINVNLVITSNAINGISHASEEQVSKIEEIHQSIGTFLQTTTANAASCEEASAASAEMYNSAGKLRSAMTKFNLRQRQYGKAYIPPEKQNDPEFIRIANENYERTIQEGGIPNLDYNLL